MVIYPVCPRGAINNPTSWCETLAIARGVIDSTPRLLFFSLENPLDLVSCFFLVYCLSLSRKNSLAKSFFLSMYGAKTF